MIVVFVYSKKKVCKLTIERLKDQMAAEKSLEAAYLRKII